MESHQRRDTLSGVDLIRNGFPWWIPLATAAAAVLIAVLISTSIADAWEARVRLWASDDRPPGEYAALLTDPNVIEGARSTMMSSEAGPARLSGLTVEQRDTLIILSVRATEAADAEGLALSIADAAIDEAYVRFEGDAGLQLLGLAQPGSQRAAPRTERNAALAAAIGLLAGFGLAAGVARTAPAPAPASNLGRLGRVGLRTIAVLSLTEPAAPDQLDEPPSSADQLADALDLVDRSIATLTAFVPLDASADAHLAATQSARALAGRGHGVLWLDARPPAFSLRITAPPPRWLAGPRWTPIPRSELIRRALEICRRRPQQVIVLSPQLVHPDALLLADLCDRVVLIAPSRAPANQLAAARVRLGRANLLGVALTGAAPGDTQAFTLARATD